MFPTPAAARDGRGGIGSVNNARIASPPPRIAKKTLSLAIDFNAIGTCLNLNHIVPSLKVNFDKDARVTQNDAVNSRRRSPIFAKPSASACW